MLGHAQAMLQLVIRGLKNEGLVSTCLVKGWGWVRFLDLGLIQELTGLRLAVQG